MNNVGPLLGVAIRHACQAVENSDYRDASSFSQLAHCCRACSHLPPSYRQQFSIEETKEKIDSWVLLFFNEARKLEPDRMEERTYSEQWRKREVAWLQTAKQMTATSATATLDRTSPLNLYLLSDALSDLAAETLVHNE